MYEIKINLMSDAHTSHVFRNGIVSTIAPSISVKRSQHQMDGRRSIEGAAEEAVRATHGQRKPGVTACLCDPLPSPVVNIICPHLRNLRT